MRKLILIVFVAILPLIAGQDPGAVVKTQGESGPVPNPPANEYVLGPGDQITVFVADLPDEFLDKFFRIDPSGNVSLPVIGRIQAAGLTTVALEAQAKIQLSHVLRNPQVAISLVTFGSQAVSVLGAVNEPGIHQLEGNKSLFEMLSLAGGLREDASYVVKVTRAQKWGSIPVPGVVTDNACKCAIATIRLSDIINGNNPAVNIPVMPGDAISVPKADIVYAVGSVVKPGGFPLNEHEYLSALQVVSLAQGFQKSAKTDKAQILRAVPGQAKRVEIAVNLKQLMAGKGTDLRLQADDILFVPNSAAKSASYKAIDSIVAAATGIAIYGRY